MIIWSQEVIYKGPKGADNQLQVLYKIFFFRMLAQSYTPNIYAPTYSNHTAQKLQNCSTADYY